MNINLHLNSGELLSVRARSTFRLYGETWVTHNRVRQVAIGETAIVPREFVTSHKNTGCIVPDSEAYTVAKSAQIARRFLLECGYAAVVFGVKKTEKKIKKEVHNVN